MVAAAAYPHARIWGFDFNPVHIAQASVNAAQAGLENLVLAPKRDSDGGRSSREGRVRQRKLREAARLWRKAQERFEKTFGAAEASRPREMLALVASDDFSKAFREA